MKSISTPPSRHKTFTYRTETRWTHGTSGIVSSEGKPPINVSSPPEFKGDAGTWTPEEMFVASVELCNMSTFLSFAARAGVPIASYRSHSNGVLEFINHQYRFTRIVIFPTITVSSAAREQEVLAVLRDAQQHCLVANSIDSIVEVNPTIVVQ
jgi:organic hydroperoxide reductase OsmC/OhrA